MTAVVVTHAVCNIDTWLKGGADREELFAKFCSSHRIFRHPDDASRVSLVCENVDLAKLKATMETAETNAAKDILTRVLTDRMSNQHYIDPCFYRRCDYIIKRVFLLSENRTHAKIIRYRNPIKF